MKTGTHTRRKCAGMTMLELMVTVGILGILFVAVAFLESTTVRQTVTLYGDARTLQRAHLALQYIQYRLYTAEVSTPVVKDSGQTLEYKDPNKAGVTSAIKLAKGKIYYYDDITKPPTTPGQGIGIIDDLQFQVLGAGNGVRVTIKTLQKYSWKLDRPYTLRNDITVRN